jgi:hypothetical protein
MRQIILLSGLCLLTACSGDNLDTPIKTCKSVASILLGSHIPATVQEAQQQTDVAQTVILSFQLPNQNKDTMVICNYSLAPVGQETDEGLFGKFERVPSAMQINGQTIPRQALFDAINQATVNAGRQVVKDANKAGAEILQNAKNTGKKMADDVNDFIQKQ